MHHNHFILYRVLQLQNSCRRTYSKTIESDWSKRTRVAKSRNKEIWTWAMNWRFEKSVESVLIATCRKRNRNSLNEWSSNTLKAYRRLRSSRNARASSHRITRKIQRACNSVLTWRFTDSSRRKSLLNQRMSDIVYHSCWNILMK